MTRTRLLNLLSLIVIIAAVIGLSMLFARWVSKAQAYEPDYIDRERLANMKALQSHSCYWYGLNCPHSYYYGLRWRYHRPQPDPEVRAVQERLLDLGYHVDADGLMGPRTREALYEFQAKAGLPATGRPDRTTTEALFGRREDKQGLLGAPPKICAARQGDTIRHCACDPVTVTTAEHLWKSGKSESMKRWKGAVRASFGELFMAWKHAANKVDACWYSGTGERSVDRHVRCTRSAHPCWGILTGDDDNDELEDAPPAPPLRKGRED